MRDFRRLVPQITEFFEQHREDFDTLRTGEFAAHNVGVHPIWSQDNAYLRLWYTYGERRVEVEQSDWYTIEWLPDEEKDAILSIMSSVLNFGWSGRSPLIGAGAAILRSTGGSGYNEGIVIYYPGIEPQMRGGRWVPSEMYDERTYTVELGYGYHLFIYVSRGPGGMGVALGMIFRTIHMFIIIVIAIVLFFMYRKWYIIRRQNADK